MKLCTLRFGNKVYLIESSLQLTLYKIVNKKFKNFRLFLKCCQEVSDSISFILIVAHYLVYNSKKIGSETSWQYIENWHYRVQGVPCWSYSNIFATFPRPTNISYNSTSDFWVHFYVLRGRRSRDQVKWGITDLCLSSWV